jgi:hypothetical protein
MARIPNAAELARMLNDIPSQLRLDLVQLVLDLIGIANPAADAASGVISLVHGDFFDAVISAIGVFPVGDVVKLGRFGRHRATMERLLGLARNNPQLARMLQMFMRTLDDLISGIRSFMGDAPPAVFNEFVQNLDGIKRTLAAYWRYIEKLRRIDRYGIGRVERAMGSSGGQFLGHGGQVISVNRLVDMLEGASPAVRRQAHEFLEQLAMSDGWRITAGIHPSATDSTRHITVLVDGIVG